MAQNAPPAIDIQDIQFKLHRKIRVLNVQNDLKSLIHLLAVSSNKGLMFVGNPYDPEFKVLKLNETNVGDGEITTRIVALISPPLALACNCDGSMLAVSYIYNNTGFLQIFHVDSFLKPEVNALYTLPVASEYNVFTTKLLWNPVIANNLAIILCDGSVGIFTLSAAGQYEKHSLGKEQQIKCGCWSPKGKQIVLGLGTGNLQQFKPNLTPARVINFPNGLHQQPFDIIEVHWLSTFQFAVILLIKGVELLPCLYIVNAPKAGGPNFINYYDICYSGPGPRQQQFAFTHIPAWNLLLVSSANGVEVGILGTKENGGENPTWLQYTLLDEARIEMPLTDDKDETYPMGFALDTSCSHQLTLGENRLPVQPIVHVLSTSGQLVSFNFLNLSSGVSNICSPPPPLTDNSGQFIPLKMIINDGIKTNTQNEQNIENATIANTNSNQYASFTKDVTPTTVSNNVITSPSMQKESFSLLFGNNNKNNNSHAALNKPFGTITSAVATTTTTTTTTLLLNQCGNTTTTTMPVSSTIFAQNSNIGTHTKDIFGQMSVQQNNNSKINNNNTNMKNLVTVSVTVNNSSINHGNNFSNKPLYTVPPIYVPPPILNQQDQQPLEQQQQEQQTHSEIMINDQNSSDNQYVETIKHMLELQIDVFEHELKQLRKQSSDSLCKLGNLDDVKRFGKQLYDLHKIIDEANDHGFETDLHTLRASMDEIHTIIKECRAKLDVYQNPNYTHLSSVPYNDAVNRRQLTQLCNYVASNRNDLEQLQQILDTQWHEFQDVVRRHSKHQMHIPCLDGVYQKMSKVKDHLMRQRQKLQLIKNKMKESGILYKPTPSNDLIVQRNATHALIRNESTIIDSLTDSMISMSLGHEIAQKRAQLTPEKLQALRNFIKQQKQVTIIRPKRPERVGLQSEVILETKFKAEHKEREQKKTEVAGKSITTTKPQQKQHQEKQQQQQQQQQHMNMKSQAQVSTLVNQSITNVAKPHASKPNPNAMSVNIFNAPSTASSASNSLNISSSSSFVKTSSVMNGIINTTTSRPLATSTPFVPYSATGLSFNFSQQQQQQQNKTPDKDLTQIPVSFNAKIVQSNNEATKSIATNIPKSNINANQLSVKPIEKNQHISNKQGTNLNLNKSNAGPVVTTATITAPVQSTGAFNFSGLASSVDLTPSTASTATSQTKTISKSQSVTSSMPLFGGFNLSTTTVATNFSVASPLTTISSTFSKAFEPKTDLHINTTTTTESSHVFSSSTSSSNTVIVTTKSQTTANFISSLSKSNVDTSKAGTTTTTMASQQSIKAVDLTPSNNLDPNAALSSLNICKPTTKESDIEGSIKSIKPVSTATASPFSLLGAANTLESGSKNIFGIGKGNTSGSSAFSFSSALTQNIPASISITPIPRTTTIPSPPSTTPVTTTIAGTTISNVKASSEVRTAQAITTAATTTSLFGVVSTTTTTTVTPLFGALNLTTSTCVSTKTTTTTSTTTQSTTCNIFGDGSNIFAKTSPTVPATTSGTFSFGQGRNIFGGVSSTTPAVSSVASPTSSSVAGSGNIFGGIPKPDQSIFGGVASTPSSNAAATPSGLFAAAAASTKPLSNATGTNIFGGSGSVAFNSPSSTAGGSIFGGSTATTVAAGPFVSAAGGSLFGGAIANQTKSSTDGSNIFGSPNAQATSGGSIFGKSAFGQSQSDNTPNTNIFGSQSQTTALGNPFGGSSTGSIFGGSGSSNVSGGSLFGGSTSSPVFGSTAPTGAQTFGAFSSQPSAGTSPFGSSSGFAQGGATVQQSGFGSPNATQQQTSAFAKPVFGGPATFGSPAPAFGAQPTFGGAPTFGSPKGFGTFATPAATSTSPPGTNVLGGGIGFGGSTQTKSNIFETLGSSDTGLSFGNLAQNTQQPVQPKPTFGGSSFLNYRS